MGKKMRGFQWTREDQPDEALVPPGRRDRTQERADNRALDALALRLAAMTPGLRARLPLDEELLEEIEILDGLGVKTAHRRQLLRVQGLLRDADLETLEAALDGDTPDAARTRSLERWRQRLLEGEDQDLQVFLEEHPDVDRQQLRALIRQARGESAGAARAARRVFQVMKAGFSDEE